MDCPYCKSTNTKKIKKKTIFGYNQYRCYNCDKQYNERTGTKLNFIEYPTEVVMIAVHYYYRFKVSLDDVVELMAMRALRSSGVLSRSLASLAAILLFLFGFLNFYALITN